MRADAAVITGGRHAAVAAPCQDYSCAALFAPDRAVAIVADGCSTGGESDLGARAWARAALTALASPGAAADAAALQDALLASPFLHLLEFDDGFATLAVLEAHGTHLRASFWGDGALLARHREGGMTLIELGYDGNAPAYLNYLRDPDAAKAWQEGRGDQSLVVATHTLDAQGTLLSLETRTFPADVAPWQWTADAVASGLDLVVLATDGISSREQGFVPTAATLLAVRNPVGEFMRRRLGRAARDWRAADTWPMDDLAIAGIWLGSRAWTTV